MFGFRSELLIAALVLLATAGARFRAQNGGPNAGAPINLANIAPLFNSFQQVGANFAPRSQPAAQLSVDQRNAINQATNILNNLGLFGGKKAAVTANNNKALLFAADKSQVLPNKAASLANGKVDLYDITSKLAPIPVPGFPGNSEVPTIPGVNTIPGLHNFNYVVGNLIPQAIPSTNTLLGASISRLMPQGGTKNMAKEVFRAVHPTAARVDVDRMMGRWFQVINSPHVIREACTVTHFGALTNNTYSATFTILKFYREGNSNGPPRFSLGYGFKDGADGQFVIHNSNSPNSEPFWVIKVGPLNEYNQYDYAVISNWIRFPVFVIARDTARFRQQHMRPVLQFLSDNNYINILTKAFNLISPVDYSSCQYTPTFSGAGK